VSQPESGVADTRAENFRSDFLRTVAALQQGGADTVAQASAYVALARAIVGIDQEARKGSLPTVLSPDPQMLLALAAASPRAYPDFLNPVPGRCGVTLDVQTGTDTQHSRRGRAR
jgi:hypothetical protein